MKCNSLEEVRKNIDSIDDKIIKLIAEHSDYVRQAAYFKKSKTDVKAADRVEKIIKKVREKSKIYGCSPDIVELIIGEEMETFEKNK
jgi:chorismate mutase, type II